MRLFQVDQVDGCPRDCFEFQLHSSEPCVGFETLEGSIKIYPEVSVALCALSIE